MLILNRVLRGERVFLRRPDNEIFREEVRIVLQQMVGTRLEDGCREQLERLATLGGRSLAAEIRLAIREHLVRAYLQPKRKGAPK